MTTAREMALRMLNGVLTKQTQMLAYEYVFAVIAILFVICLPLIFLLKSSRTPPPAAEHAVVEA